MSDHPGDALAVTLASPETFRGGKEALSHWAAPVSWLRLNHDVYMQLRLCVLKLG